MRARFEDLGYLYLPGLLPSGPLLDVRLQVLEICQSHQWLLPGSILMDGLGSSESYHGLFEFTDAFTEFQRLEAFHALAHRLEIEKMLEALLGGPVFPHPRNILRVTLPQSHSRTTPAHQDYPLIQGSERFVTVWLPLGDCPASLGNLALAAGGHKAGPLPLVPIDGTGGVTVDMTQLELEWHNSDMDVGDVLVINSLTPHQALPNNDASRIRLSCDLRYQRVGEPVTWDSLEPHMKRMTWGEVYHGWQSADYQYYWHKLHLDVVPFQPPFEEETVTQARELVPRK